MIYLYLKQTIMKLDELYFYVILFFSKEILIWRAQTQIYFWLFWWKQQQISYPFL